MRRILDPTQTIPKVDLVHYPESDGKPMGETDFHISAILYLLSALRFYFRQAPDVYVAADMLFYYEEGNPAVFTVPDVFVVKGTHKAPRRIYKLWEERIAPAVIFEITSRGTRLEDLATKRGLYEMLGVREYFLFDPLDEYLKPRLQGFRVRGGYYQPIVPQAEGTLLSEELGLILRPEGPLLRIVDPTTNRAMPTLDEAVELASEEAERAEREAERAEREAEHARAEAERAEREAQRAERAEAEVARLREELERLRRASSQAE